MMMFFPVVNSLQIMDVSFKAETYDLLQKKKYFSGYCITEVLL